MYKRQNIKVFKPEADLLLDTSFSYEVCCLAPFVTALRDVYKRQLPARADTVALYRAVGAARDGVPAGDLRPLFAKLGARGAGKALSLIHI